MPFPTTAKLLLGKKLSAASALLRTEMESGPAKQTRVRSQQQVQRAVQYRMTATEKAAFEDWFETEINRGASFFSWIDERGVTRNVQILNGEYEIDEIYVSEASPVDYLVSYTLVMTK